MLNLFLQHRNQFHRSMQCAEFGERPFLNVGQMLAAEASQLLESRVDIAHADPKCFFLKNGYLEEIYYKLEENLVSFDI